MDAREALAEADEAQSELESAYKRLYDKMTAEGTSVANMKLLAGLGTAIGRWTDRVRDYIKAKEGVA